MMDCADLEIGLHHYSIDATQVSYMVDFRYNQPDNAVEIRLDPLKPALASFDLDALRAAGWDASAYGKLLSDALFTPDVREAFGKARAAAESMELALRLRLTIGPSAPELHSLRWETLLDPQNGSLLCTSSSILFSRYLSSADWRPVRLKPQGTLRTLALIANPSNLPEFQLPALDLPAETARVTTGLSGIPLDLLTGGQPGKRANLASLEACLRSVDYDILYIVSHGRHRPDGTYLYLEDADGKVDITPGSRLADLLSDLPSRPRLVFLVACESAGKGDDTTLSGLGPRLAEAGIPAVVAMQGPVAQETMARFIPAFFTELQHSGVVDSAFSAARSAVRDCPDAWVPVLYQRLKTGKLWYVPGFGDKGADSNVWPRLMLRLKSFIDRPTCPGPVTPMIGHGLVEPLIGSLREIARRWADQHHYPMAPFDRESLAQVAQYLSVDQDERFPYENLVESLRQEVQRRFAGQLPAGSEHASLASLIDLAGAVRRQNPLEAHRVLANLPLPIYLTANFDALMEAALKEAKKDPQVVLCPWFLDSDQIETVYDRERYIPSADRPLVYHLFGRLDTPESVVLTEDDYFNYLMGISRNKDRIPKDVLRALADSTLLFIGFQLEDWNFRVLLRSILALADESKGRRPTNIAAQIEPEEGRILEPEGARRYVEKYFSQDAKISLYWGSVDDFIGELQKRWTDNS
jgi:hypothetical protein